MTSDELTAVIARRHDALGRRDSTTLSLDYAEDCVLESPSWGTVHGRDAVRRVFGEFFAAFPDCLFEFGELLIVDSRVAETVTIHGTNSGGFFGETPTGRPFRLFMVNLLTILDRGIVHERRVYDVGGFMLQLAAGGSEVAAQLYRATLARAQTEHELRMAANIQQALMPPALRTGIGYELASSSRPCRSIGGDFIDHFSLADGAFAFVLGDVAGKGPAAALLAAVLQGIFTANAYRCGTPNANERSQRGARPSRDRPSVCDGGVRRAPP